MKTKIFAIFAIAFLMISISTNSVKADAGCNANNRNCWAFAAGDYIMADAAWYITAPTLYYNLWTSGSDGTAQFSFWNSVIATSNPGDSYPSQARGSISSPRPLWLDVQVYAGYYSSAQAQFSW